MFCIFSCGTMLTSLSLMLLFFFLFLILMISFQNGDEESLDYPSHYLDAYSASKAEAERLVLSANGSPTGPQARWARSPGPDSGHGDDSGELPPVPKVAFIIIIFFF